MALKFLNKKGWHTGSLRNIENVWKAEQKHDAEQKKLEELRKQIREERERSEFRLLQEKAGLVPHQERLEFLYDSGLSVGKSSSEGFKALEAFPKSDATDAPSSSASASKEEASVPGALFEDKPHSANDAWRKLHSDPLLMIRQREQEALAKIRNNPVKMAMIKKSVEGKEHKKKDHSKMLMRAVARPLTSNVSPQFHFPSDQLLHRHISEINSLITSYIRRGDPVSAWNLFRCLRRVRSDIDAYTFTPLLRPSPISLGKQLHTQMITTGADFGIVAKTSLLDMYSRHGSLDESVKVFDEMGHRDVVAWNALLSCFLRCDLPRKAIGVLREMGRENVELSEFTLCSVLKSCASLKALELGRQVHGLVVSLGRDLVVLSTALIDFYSSVGRVDDALKVFYCLKGWKDDVMHNSLVSGCIRNRRYGEAFKVMSLVKPNAVALTGALVCCSETLDLWVGKQVHCVAIRRGFTFETQLCNALLDMYAKCGKILHAWFVFDGICQKDVISWTCMIDAYGRNGCGSEAIELFQKMREDGSEVLPNSVTFLSVLSACDHSGQVEEGKKCFHMFKEKYGLEPDPEHYACFIDILGRAGNIEQVWSAYHDMIKQGAIPTAGVWIALLNACSLNQDFERGEFAAKHLLRLEPDEASNIVLVSNFYAAFGRWDCVDELRSIMRTKGLVKEAGNSWISAMGFNQHATSLSA